MTRLGAGDAQAFLAAPAAEKTMNLEFADGLANGRAIDAKLTRDMPDTASAVAAVVAFFTAVAAASGNQVLALSQAPLNVLLVPTLTQVIDGVPQARERIEAAQAKIVEAIKLKKSENARNWMEKHIRDFKRGYELKREG